MGQALERKVVWVTGSSRGIGKQAARLLLARGATVVLNGRDPERLEQTRAELEPLAPRPGQLLAVAGDVTDPAQARAMAATIEARCGGLDALVNNAGLSMRGPFAELSAEVAETILRSNIQGALLPTLAAFPLLVRSRGQVLFVSSLAGVRGFPGVSVYSAGKMALTALAQSIRAEGRPLGVHAGIVYLGFTENDAEKTILTADGRRIHHQRKAQLTQAQAAAALVEAVLHRRRAVYTTLPGKLLALAQGWAPGLTDWLVRRSAGKLHGVRERA